MVKLGGYNHREAYCLMIYSTNDKQSPQITEILWNSRDGVTPFIISTPDGKREMQHIAWDADICIRNFNPPRGMRYFVTATPDLVRDKAVEFVNEYWEDSEFPMKKRFDNKQEAVASIIKEWCKDGNPWIVTSGVDDTAKNRMAGRRFA